MNPADVNWIWIQGDRGISVREMNDSWGNAIRYYGKNDGFELRSSGTDGNFYTKDDIFRIQRFDSNSVRLRTYLFYRVPVRYAYR